MFNFMHNRWHHALLFFGILCLAVFGGLVAWGRQIPWIGDLALYLTLTGCLGVFAVFFWMVLCWRELNLASCDKAPTFFVWAVLAAGTLISAGAFTKALTVNFQPHGLAVAMMGLGLMTACVAWRLRMIRFQSRNPIVPNTDACGDIR